MKKYDSVDAFVDSQEKWQDEVAQLRKVVNSVGLVEAIKWSMPVYEHQSKNVVGIFATKTYFGLWFYQGALMDDPDQVLINAQEGKTKALRQWRMTHKKEIKTRKIKQYILNAMKLVEEGKEIKPNRAKPVLVPKELREAFKQNQKAKKAFAGLSKSCRREYAEYISEAKRDETKQRRIKKIMPMIEKAIGLNDKYRK